MSQFCHFASAYIRKPIDVESWQGNVLYFSYFYVLQSNICIRSRILSIWYTYKLFYNILTFHNIQCQF